MHVYRFENQHGQGPWSGGGRCAYIGVGQPGRKRIDPSRMNSPCGEPSNTPCHQQAFNIGMAGYHCAFATKAQLRRFFGNAKGRKAMEERGGQRLYVFDVPDQDVLRGAHQVIFRKDRAVKVAVLDMETLQIDELL